MTRAVLISVINWNSSVRTLNCIQMLQRQNYPHKKIVVVDNASRSDDLKHLRLEAPDDVEIIEAKENTGYAGGHAYALTIAEKENYDFFWLLNTDLKVPPHVLSSFLQAYDQFGEAIYGSVPL